MNNSRKSILIAVICAMAFAFQLKFLNLDLIVSMRVIPIIYLILIPLLIRNDQNEDVTYVVSALSVLYTIPFYLILALIWFGFTPSTGHDFFRLPGIVLLSLMGHSIAYVIFSAPLIFGIAYLYNAFLIKRNGQ